MSQMFFKSNAEGSEIVRLQGEITWIDFSEMTQAVEGVTFAFEELAHAFATVKLTFEDVNGFSAMIVKMLRARDKLKRQHKAKARGRNWRNVR